MINKSVVITRVKFYKKGFCQYANTIANCSITLNNELSIDGIKFCRSKINGECYIHVPSRNIGGIFISNVNISSKLKRKITRAILDKYKYLKFQGLWHEEGELIED
jgi:DNA-binding cell septation regulator SpoVG